MKRNKIVLKLLALTLTVALLATSFSGCSLMKGGEKEFDDYLEEMFTALFSGDGISVNFLLANPAAYGLDEEVASVSAPMSKEEYEKGYSSLKLQSKLMRLMFDYNKLNEKQQVWFDYLTAYFNNRAEYGDFYYLQDDFLGSYLGFQAQLPIYLAQYTLGRKHDVDNVLNLMTSAAEVFPKYVDYERERVENGYGRADFFYTAAIEQCENFSGVSILGNGETVAEQNFLIPLLTEKINACQFLTADEKADYAQKVKTTVETVLIPAYVNLGEGMIEFIGGENNNQLGLAHYKNGNKYYELLFRDATGVSDSVDTAFDKISADLSKATDGAAGIMLVLKEQYGLSSEEVYDKLDALMAADDENWTTEKMYETVNNLKSLIANDFPMLTTCGQIVLENIHPSLKDNYSPAAYFTSKLDDLNANQVIIVNTYSDNRGSYNTFDLLSHEGFPGHLYQDVYFKNSGLPKTIRAMSSSGYMEGWATYAEQYAAKYYRPNTADNELYKLYLLSNKMSQYVVAQSDILVNYKGYTREQLAEFLNSGNYHYNVDALFEHVVEVPTNVLKYYYTSLKIEELRASFDNLSDLEFHTLLMKYGPVSLGLYIDKLAA